MNSNKTQDGFDHILQVIQGGHDWNPIRPIREKENEIRATGSRGCRSPVGQHGLASRRLNDTGWAISSTRFREIGIPLFVGHGVIKGLKRMFQHPQEQIGELGKNIHNPRKLTQDCKSWSKSTEG